MFAGILTNMALGWSQQAKECGAEGLPSPCCVTSSKYLPSFFLDVCVFICKIIKLDEGFSEAPLQF
jgi:hypothetical protein